MAPADDDQVTRLAFKAGRGDSGALEEFIRATQRDVWRTVAYLADRGCADDLAQETYLRAMSALPRFSGRSTARTWLLSIARRVVVDQIRHDRSRPRASHAIDVEQVLQRARPLGGFESLVEVGMLVDGLDADRRHALLLTQVLGMPYAEAAEVCGCPVGTIRSRVARARDELLAAVDADGLTG